jgi:hypothetical protein
MNYLRCLDDFFMPCFLALGLSGCRVRCGMTSQIYSKFRMSAIGLFMALNCALALIDTLDRRFPIGVGPVLCLLPCLLREWDLRNGRAPRALGKLGWSYIFGGVIWVASWPLLAR